jgi:hypothetical protein
VVNSPELYGTGAFGKVESFHSVTLNGNRNPFDQTPPLTVRSKMLTGITTDGSWFCDRRFQPF